TDDGKLLACGGKEIFTDHFWVLENFYCWNVKTGKVVSDVEGPASRYNFAAYARDGETLFLANKTTLEVWQTNPPKLVRSALQKDSGFLSFALSHDSKVIASASWGGIIQLWDAATLKEVKKLEGAGYRVTALGFSPDAKVLATAENGIIRLWVTATG